MNKVKCLVIFIRLWENDFYFIIELYFSLLFELLIVVLFFVQVIDVSVNKVIVKFYLVVNMFVVMLVLGVDGVKLYIKIIGLFNSKVENVIKICCILLEQYNGEVLEDRVVLEVLFGVGCKIVNVVLNIVFGWLIIVVDMYIFCVCNWMQFVSGKNVEQVEEKFLKVVFVEFKVDCYYWLILYGCYICIVCKLCCGFCLIEDFCEYKDKVYV